jgi:hypothetical protein
MIVLRASLPVMVTLSILAVPAARAQPAPQASSAPAAPGSSAPPAPSTAAPAPDAAVPAPAGSATQQPALPVPATATTVPPAATVPPVPPQAAPAAASPSGPSARFDGYVEVNPCRAASRSRSGRRRAPITSASRYRPERAAQPRPAARSSGTSSKPTRAGMRLSDAASCCKAASSSPRSATRAWPSRTTGAGRARTRSSACPATTPA